MENQKLGKEKGFIAGMAVGVISCVLAMIVIVAGTKLFDYVRANLLRSTTEESPAETLIGGKDSIVTDATMRKMAAIEELIAKNYYKTDITLEELEEGIYQGIVDALEDPYADYYSSDELIAARASMEGVSYGIGAYISYDEKKEMPVISGIIEGGSAEEADLREGDIIVKVNDEDVQGYSTTEVVMLVRGEENTKVRLTIYREGELDYLEYELLRKKALEKTTVIYNVREDGIGYVGITEFDDITVDQYTEAMAVLKENKVKGMILDLRSNPGGNVSAVTEIARKILPEGLIVYTEDRNGKREEYQCDGKNELQVPLVVLVNEYSASASEILAGAIQDHGKGKVVGTATYGKGVVQRIVNLSDGTAVKLTVSSYFTPKGRNLGGVGVKPDVELDLDREAFYAEGTDNQMEKAVEVLKEEMN